MHLKSDTVSDNKNVPIFLSLVVVHLVIGPTHRPISEGLWVVPIEEPGWSFELWAVLLTLVLLYTSHVTIW
jgi:hypothetical protein